FAAHIDDAGKVWLVQFQAIAHDLDGSSAAAYDDAASTIAGLVHITASLTDRDGDTVSAVSQSAVSLQFQDDFPVAQAGGTHTLAEGTIDAGILTFIPGADGATITQV